MGNAAERVPIVEVVAEPSTWDPPGSGSDVPFRYIDISSIDPAEKRVVSTTTLAPSEAPSRARQLVQKDDVLVSTVRPNLNAVAIVPNELDGATASTGFAVLRPKADRLDPRYLYHWVRTPWFVRAMTARATGASYPAVTDRIVRDSKIPLPSLAEQRRFAAILDKADVVRRKRRESLRLLDEFLIGAYAALVGPGNPSHSNWPLCQIAELAESRNAMRTGPFGSALRHSEFVDSGIAVLGIDNAVQNRFGWAERRFISEEKYRQFMRYTVKPGDVIVTIMGTTGRSAVVPDDIPLAISTKHLAVITVDRSRVHPEFLSHAIHSDRAVLAQISGANRGAIMAGLNLGLIKRLRLRLPPLEAQERFAATVTRVSRIRERMEGSSREADHLLDSLAQWAFGKASSEAARPALE